MANILRIRQVITRLALIAALLIPTTFVGTAVLIGAAVDEVSEAARREQPVDRVLALMAYVESPKHTPQERNRAVWALGQLGDARALPVLEQYSTADECDHTHRLCQHELRKAIRLCKGATNLTAPLWR